MTLRLTLRSTLARLLPVLGAALIAAACSTPPPPKPPVSAVPKTGTVGLVSAVKERGINQDNFGSAFWSIWQNDHKTDSNVAQQRFEVTVFYDDGSQGVVTVSEKPTVQPGQRIRVTGDKIEPLKR